MTKATYKYRYFDNKKNELEKRSNFSILKLTLLKTENADSRSVKVGGEGRKSVLCVLPVSTDSDSNCGESVLPSVLPDQNCGKCGCELSGQTFQGPAGLGLICAECQAELDRASGQGERTDEQMINLIRGAIYKLGYVCGIHECSRKLTIPF